MTQVYKMQNVCLSSNSAFKVWYSNFYEMKFIKHLQFIKS